MFSLFRLSLFPFILLKECEIEKGKDDEDISARGSRALPFEFIALEACLEAACTCLENEVKNISSTSDMLLLKCR